MLSYTVISTDVVNGGKLIEITLPNATKKRINVRFANPNPTTTDESDSITTVVNEIELSYNNGTLTVP